MTSQEKAKVSQIDRFKEAARQLEVDESEAAFDEKLKMVTGQKTAPLARNPDEPEQK